MLFRSPEMLQCNDAREARAIDHVPRIGEDVDGKPYMPHLRPRQPPSGKNERTRTRCPASTHRLSLSTASLRLSTLSSIRVSATSWSVGLRAAKEGEGKREGNTRAERRRERARGAHTHLPAGLVLVRRHRRELRVDREHALERPLRRRAHHLPVHLREHPASRGARQSARVLMGEGGGGLTASCPSRTRPSRAPGRR